ncbi:MAG TPA: ABATE domain-containing protein [bacterium]|nr:ABATE domain-containing protein [bacterium]
MGLEAGRETKFEFVGGRLCLDFVNTLNGSRARPDERLLSYRDLVAWGRQAGVLTDPEARRLAQAGLRRPEEAAKALADAVALRETIYRIFAAGCEGRAPDRADLAVLNAALPRAFAHLRVSPQGEDYAWEWAVDDALDRMVWPVARSAAELLVSDEASRVGRCGQENCDWLFFDTSRNHSRRWCTMRGCGNRAKARRYYARKKSGG